MSVADNTPSGRQGCGLRSGDLQPSANGFTSWCGRSESNRHSVTRTGFGTETLASRRSLLSLRQQTHPRDARCARHWSCPATPRRRSRAVACSAL